MALADIIAAHAALMTGVVTHVGAEWIDRYGSPPSLTWVPTSETFQSAGRVTPAAVSSIAQRSHGTRVAGVDVHIWAAGDKNDSDDNRDLRATEALIDRTIVMLRRAVGPGAFVINGGTWAPVADNQLGRLYILRLLFSLPIIPAAADETSAQTTFTGVDVVSGQPARTGTLHLPSGDVTAKPVP